MTAANSHTNDVQLDGNAPAVSVVVPAYNVAPYIGAALASAFAQTFTDFEVIVVNDGSPDTVELERALAPYRARIVYLQQENRGPSAARNTGIRHARGRYVALLDADDLWLPEYLAAQMHALTSDPTLDLIYSDALLFGAGAHAGQTFMQTCPSRGPVTVDTLLSQQCVVITSCVVARRTTLLDAGLFDENYYRSEDFDLWVRLAHNGARLAYQQQVLAQHRLRPDSLAGDQTRMQECAMEVYAKLARKLTLTPPQLALIKTEITKYQFNLALASGKHLLSAGEFAQAATELNRARALQRRAGLNGGRKLRLALLLLRVAPRLAQRVYLKRDPRALPEVTTTNAPPEATTTDARITL